MTNQDSIYSKLHIVIIDDDSLSRGYLRTALNTLGTTTIAEFGRASDALEQYNQLDPDILFLDINLPDIPGLEVLKQILEIKPKAFVVMVSGHSSFENVKTALDSGARGFIVKPFTTQKLIETVDRYIATLNKRVIAS